MENKKEISETFYKRANDLIYEIEDLDNYEDNRKIYRIALFLESVYDEAYEQGLWDGTNKE